MFRVDIYTAVKPGENTDSYVRAPRSLGELEKSKIPDI